jgi:poly(hydroxyalkanoate) granule-associated protein
MTKPKLRKRTPAEDAAQQARGVSKTVMDSAQQIWLAGLGAFVKAQAEGGKLFESLVTEGAALDAKTRKFTDAKVSETRGTVEATLGQVRERSQETRDKLEKVFEDRVSRALGHLGVPGRDEIRSLSSKVDELSRELRKVNRGAVPKKRAAKSSKPSKR